MSDEKAFELIGLPPTATEREVQRAYRSAALLHHPDRGGSSDAMKELNCAYEIALEVAREREEKKPEGGAQDFHGVRIHPGNEEPECKECGDTKKVKVTRGWSSVEVACPKCAVEEG